MDICRNTSITLALFKEEPRQPRVKRFIPNRTCMCGKEGGSPKCLFSAVKISPWGKF
jgi:hypothetical protein